jgi:hypothetical protein
MLGESLLWVLAGQEPGMAISSNQSPVILTDLLGRFMCNDLVACQA